MLTVLAKSPSDADRFDAITKKRKTINEEKEREERKRDSFSRAP